MNTRKAWTMKRFMEGSMRVIVVGGLAAGPKAAARIK